MPELFVTADLHIGHRSVVLYNRREKFIYPNPDYDSDKPKNFKTNWPETVDIEAHDNWIIDEVWNSVVGKKDFVIIVGDFIWNNHMKYLSRLNGRKILVIGNHDKVSQWYKGTFDISGWNFEVQMDADEYVAEKYPRQFSEIHNELHKTYDKKIRIIYSHCPYLTWPGSCHGSWNVHGHCHGRLEEFEDVLRTDVGIDPWGRLVHFDVLKEKMLSRHSMWEEKMKKRNESDNIGETQGSLYENRKNNSKYFDIETNEHE